MRLLSAHGFVYEEAQASSLLMALHKLVELSVDGFALAIEPDPPRDMIHLALLPFQGDSEAPALMV